MIIDLKDGMGKGAILIYNINYSGKFWGSVSCIIIIGNLYRFTGLIFADITCDHAHYKLYIVIINCMFHS